MQVIALTVEGEGLGPQASVREARDELLEPLGETSFSSASSRRELESSIAELGEGGGLIEVPAEVGAELVAELLWNEPGMGARVRQAPGAVDVLLKRDDQLRVAMANIHSGAEARSERSVGRRLYMARHGECRTFDESGAIHSWAPLPLTARGRDQARALAPKVAPADVEVLHASDLERAHETARLAAGDERQVLTHAELRELSLGSLEGATWDAILDACPGWLVDPDARSPDGESPRLLLERAWPKLEQLLETERDVVCFGHGALNRVLLSRLLEIEIATALRLRQDWGCLSVLEHDGSQWALETFNWTDDGLAELTRQRPAPDMPGRVWDRLVR